MTELNFEARGIAKAAERTMRRWVVGQQVQQGIEREAAIENLPAQIHPYIAISRQTGAGAEQIACRLGERLGWEVIDKQLLDCIAERFDLPQDMLAQVDEKHCSWMWEAFGKWLDHHIVTQTEYVAHLGRTVLMLAHQSSAIFVGRGAQFVLPRDRGLTVRIVAPIEQRVSRVMQEQRCIRDVASDYIALTDRDRRDFVRKYFHHDVADSDLYDLIIDMSNLEIDDGVEFILSRCQARFPESPQS